MAESNNEDKQHLIDEMLELVELPVSEVEHPEGIEMTEWTFTNDKTNPMIRHMFHLLMKSAFANKIGVMHAKIKDTNEVHTVIVGVQVMPDGSVATWPIAKVFTEEEQDMYEAPDGQGNYVKQT